MIVVGRNHKKVTKVEPKETKKVETPKKVEPKKEK